MLEEYAFEMEMKESNFLHLNFAEYFDFQKLTVSTACNVVLPIANTRISTHTQLSSVPYL